ncbi:MAG TPA: PAS domain S-box protein, partial [Polyangia bacterium]
MDAGGERSGGGRAEHISLFDAANDAIFVHDADTGQIVDVNLRMTEMYGYSVEEACGLSVADLSAGEPYTQARAVELLRKAATGEPQLFEWHARDRAGRRFWVEVNIKRAAVAGTERLLAIVRDVTERKRAEAERAELLARAQEAAREAEEARADNARLFEQAERRAAALAEERLRREHFISLVAHELRGSMSVISGYAALLRQGAIPDEARHTRALEVIAKQVHSLDRLVSDLLDLSLIEAGRFSVVRSPTDLLAVAREVVQHYHDCAAGHELILVLPPEP